MTFHRFSQSWLEQLQTLVHHLCRAPKPPATVEDNHKLRQLVRDVTAHYEAYYRAKSIAAEQDVLAVFTAPWCTYLERSLHWVAGWRPTTAFHLIYTETSIRFESRVVDILRGLRTGDLADLSPAQFNRVSELQCLTVQEENAISDELSNWQDSATDVAGFAANMGAKMEELTRILKKADELRLKTITRVVEFLTPQQAVEFFIAVAGLQFGIHAWGINLDRQRGAGTA